MLCKQQENTQQVCKHTHRERERKIGARVHSQKEKEKLSEKRKLKNAFFFLLFLSYHRSKINGFPHVAFFIVLSLYQLVVDRKIIFILLLQCVIMYMDAYNMLFIWCNAFYHTIIFSHTHVCGFQS